MAVLTLTFSGDELPTGVVLNSVTRNDTGAAVTTFSPTLTGPSVFTWTNAEADLTYTYHYTATLPTGQTYSGTATSSGLPAGAQATGLITNQSLLCSELGTKNVYMLSTQDPDSDGSTPNVPQIQNAITWAESYIQGVLANDYQIPLTVGGVAVLQAGGYTLALLQQVANLLAGHYLNKWRQVQSNETPQTLSAVDAQAKLWMAKADGLLAKMNRWAEGYSDGVAVTLDLLTSSPRYLSQQNGGGIPAIRGFRAQPLWGGRGSLVGVGRWC